MVHYNSCAGGAAGRTMRVEPSGSTTSAREPLRTWSGRCTLRLEVRATADLRRPPLPRTPAEAPCQEHIRQQNETNKSENLKYCIKRMEPSGAMVDALPICLSSQGPQAS